MEMHWILTLQWQVANNMCTWSGNGLTYPQPGQTRSDVLAQLRQEISNAPTGVPLLTNVMFFDLAPNKLNGH